MEPDRQVVSLELEPVGAHVGRGEMDGERTDGLGPLLGTPVSRPDPLTVALDRERFALEELGGQTREMSATRAHVHDASREGSERRRRTEQRSELLPLAFGHPAQRRGREAQRWNTEPRQSRNLANRLRERQEFAWGARNVAQPDLEPTFLTRSKLPLVERKEKLRETSPHAPSRRLRILDRRSHDVEHRGEHAQRFPKSLAGARGVVHGARIVRRRACTLNFD